MNDISPTIRAHLSVKYGQVWEVTVVKREGTHTVVTFDYNLGAMGTMTLQQRFGVQDIPQGEAERVK
jgi:hypothetical protein